MKIKLPKRFYTPEQLAERWECKVEDISHLIETGDLKTTPYLAALHGKRNIQLQVISDYPRYAKARDEANTGDTYDVVRWFHRLSKEEYAEHLLNELRTAKSEKMDLDPELDFGLSPKTALAITPLPPDITAADLAMLLQDGDYPYPRTIGEATDDLFRELHEDGSYDEVITAAEVSRFEREHGDTKTPTAITARTETAYLNVIGGLVSLLLGKSPSGKAHSVFENQAAVRDALLNEYGHVKGMGDSNLDKILAQANRTLKNSLIPGG